MSLEESLLNNTSEAHNKNYFYSYGLLTSTIILEIMGTIFLKLSMYKKSYLFPCYIFYIISLTTFSFVLKEIPLSIAYTTWCSIGTIGVTITSQFLFYENISIEKWMCIIVTIPPIICIQILP